MNKTRKRALQDGLIVFGGGVLLAMLPSQVPAGHWRDISFWSGGVVLAVVIQIMDSIRRIDV